MSHEVETMFSRDVPWHGLGKVTGEALTAADAIVAAGLDWTVEKRPVYVGLGKDRKIRIQDKFATVRSFDDKPLGVVGRDFVPLQNTEAFDLLNDLVNEGELRFDSAGALRGGSVVWVCAKLPAAVKLLGHEDLELNVVLSHGHDGSRAIDVMITPVLVVCMNTLTLAGETAKSRLHVQHRANAKARIAQGAQVLGLMYDYAEEMKRVAEQLAASAVLEAEVDSFLGSLYADMPSEKARAKHVEGTKATLLGSGNIRDEVRLTKWGEFNAVTEWWDWKRPMRDDATPETRVRSTWEGPGKRYREKALGLLGVR